MRDSDVQVIQTIVALAALEQEPSGNIIAEVHVSETPPVIDAILLRAEGILARDAVNRVMCLKALNPIIGEVFESLVSFVSGEELYCRKPEELGVKAPCTFRAACEQCRNSTCIGLKRSEVSPCGSRQSAVDIASRDEQKVEKDDKLVVIAKEMSSNAGPRERARMHLMKRTEQSCLSDSPTTGKWSSIRRRISGSGSPTFVVIGISDSFFGFVRMLDRYVSKGTKIHLIGDMASKEEQITYIDTKCEKLDNIEFDHHVGHSLTSLEKLEELPWQSVSVIFVLSCNETAARSDAASLATTVSVHGLLKAKGIENAGIICEVRSLRTHRMLQRTLEQGVSDLMQRATFFHSYALETGIFAAASAERAVFNTLLTLMEPGGTQFVTETAGKYGALGSHKFEELWKRARDKGDILVGWCRHIEGNTSSMVELNPRRDATVSLSHDDSVIVIRGGSPV